MTSTHSPLTTKITALLSASPARPILVALDGRCGSGKTTLANQLAEAFPGNVTVHTDNYYLPPADRVPGWEKIPCANMDLRRLRTEVLEPARAWRSFACKAYSCREGAYLPPVACAPARLVLIEGSYSHHPSLADCYDLRIFVTCSKAEQARRLQAREGARYAAFVERWIPLEEGYFTKYAIPQSADLILDTENGMIVP